ncbi:hypothetical protein CUZ94_2473 [Enterococcus faecium]|nr:hypothetical protein [Enterococcus faecium]MBK4865322.1 hypothetical protein [Enterococcus faecium]MBK4878913.1 hypothetical protein [Enterococcus faecium]
MDKKIIKEADMNIQKALIELTINGVVTCEQLAYFYDDYHGDREFSDAVNFLSGSIVIDMAQLKNELYASEDSHVLGAVEYMQKHYPSAVLLINLIPKDKRKFIH